MTQDVAPAVLRRVWLSVEEVSQVTGVSTREVYDALRVGDLVGTQRSRRKKWRIHESDMDKWMRGGASWPNVS